MAESILVSIVIPTHRRPDSLRSVLDSLDRQTFPADQAELIVVGSPNDPGFAVVADRPRGRFPIRYSSVPGDQSGGRSPSAKRNYGAQIGRGEWIAYIDDDCLAEPGWLVAAARMFPGNVAVEGAKKIPPVAPPTLTYKGLKQFERPGGFQSCNIFFRRDVLLAVGGFDPRFPFYLEDSDLAWTFLDAGHPIPHAGDAVVSHPVVPPQPWRLLEDARRGSLLRLLERKHPDRFRLSFRVLRGWQWLMLGLDVCLAAGVLVRAWWLAGAAAAGVVLLTGAIGHRWFRGCRFTKHEALITVGLIPIVPVVKATQYLRGCLRHRGPVTQLAPLPDMAV